MRKLLSTLFLLVFFILTFSHTVNADIVAESHYYRKTALPGSAHTFSARLRNTGDDDVIMYGAVVLTTSGTTSFELYSNPGFLSSLNLHSGARGEMNIPIRLPEGEGSYSVSILVFNAADDTVLVTVFGSFPLLIGTPTQSINVHPSRVNFGKLHFGRFMYPIPIKVRYKIFIPNRIGDPQPWTIRIYTDNGNKFKGLKGAVKKLPIGGLVHSLGKYVIPLKFWNLNWGPDAHLTGWDAAIQGPPPVDDDRFWKGALTDESTPDRPIHDHDLKPWLSVHDYSDMTADPHTWRRNVGIFPYDGQFINPTNSIGNYELSRSPDPFEFYFAIDANSTSVRGKYSGRVILELFSP